MEYNRLARNIHNAGEYIQSDEACKRVLANKQILAWILEAKKSHYENIKKVYSIWICLNPKVTDRDSIVEYSIKRKVVRGKPSSVAKEDYDKLKIAVSYIGGKGKQGVLGMLNTLFEGTAERLKNFMMIME